MTCINNTIESDGSSGGTGIGVYAGMYGTYDVEFVATGNSIRYWQWGIELYEYAPNNLISAEIHYNNIEGNTDYGIYNYLTDVYNATYNWWGDASGPYHAVNNPTGQGDTISDYVLFIPWLDAAYPSGSSIDYYNEEVIPPGTSTVEIPGTGVTITVDSTTGTTVTVQHYTENPGSTTFPGLSTPFGDYIDISVGDPGAVSWPIYLQINYTTAELAAAHVNEYTLYGISFYNDTAGEWQLCSDTGVNTADFDGYAGYVWANLHQGELSPKVIVTWPFPIGGVMFPVNAVGMLVPILSVIALIVLIGGTTVTRRKD